MGSFIVGTAGHIDHGKSALVRALTGTDPDRLKEEKERGITIDLGFAHRRLPSGIELSFVDVPGHERFVKNMLAGAHGIDAVMLVVAADESVMPQTREHFAICTLLGIGRGLVALTKCDVADAETQALVEAEVRDLVRGSFLEGAPAVRVSSRTGQGIADLERALESLARERTARPATGLLRLPVDRVFTLHGFGTIVTGTLVGGRIAAGDEVEILPRGLRARVRGLEVHGESVRDVAAGTRAAVNLSGVEVTDLRRGDVLVRPGTIRATSMIDAEIRLLPGARVLKDQSRLRVHVASAEILGRVRLLGPATLEPGGSALAQLRLEAAAVAGRGDRLVLRSYSPAETIGGATVLDPAPPKRRGTDVERVRLRRTTAPGDLAGAARAVIDEAGLRGVALSDLAVRLTVPLAELRTALAGAEGIVLLDGTPAAAIAEAACAALAASVVEELTRFHAHNPLKASMPREELRMRIAAAAAPGAFDEALRRLLASRRVAATSDAVGLTQHSVRLTDEESEVQRHLIGAAQSRGLQGIEAGTPAIPGRGDSRVVERMSRVLLDNGTLRRVGDSLLVHRDHLEALKGEVRRRFPPGSRLDVGQFKEMTGLSRKYVIPLLEYLDRERVTRRAGTDRFVLS